MHCWQKVRSKRVLLYSIFFICLFSKINAIIPCYVFISHNIFCIYCVYIFWKEQLNKYIIPIQVIFFDLGSEMILQQRSHTTQIYQQQLVHWMNDVSILTRQVSIFGDTSNFRSYQRDEFYFYFEQFGQVKLLKRMY